ncbi:MAG: hypothetical protein MK077_10620 [Phycisphaerales bacterium]|nr:hypothetical protein [Phycisphaerales bacterium]
MAKEAVVVTTGQGASALGTLVGNKVLTSLLDPSVYGLVALGMSVVNFIIYLIGTPIRLTATRFYGMATEANQLAGYQKLLVRIAIALSTILLPTAVVLLAFSSVLYSLVALVSLLLCIDAIYIGIQTGARNRGIVACLQTLLSWSRFTCAAILLVLYGHNSVELVFTGYCISALLNVGLQIVLCQTSIPKQKLVESKSQHQKLRSQFYTYLWPLLVTGPISWGQLFVDRWAIMAFGSMGEVGIYFALYQISFAPTLLLYSCVYYFMAPLLFEQAGKVKSAAKMRRVYLQVEIASVITISLTIVVAWIAWLIHDWIGDLLLAKAYTSHSYLLSWLILTGGLYASANQFLMSVQSSLSLRPILIQRILGFVIATTCYMVGCHLYGLEGAVAGGVLYATLYLLLSVIIHFRVRTKTLERLTEPQ